MLEKYQSPPLFSQPQMQKRSGLDSLRNSILSLPPRTKQKDRRIWNGLRTNTAAYASSPKAGLSSWSPGSSENYRIWKESASLGTWDPRRITSADAFPGPCPQPPPPWSPLELWFCIPATATTALLVFHPKEHIYV